MKYFRIGDKFAQEGENKGAGWQYYFFFFPAGNCQSLFGKLSCLFVVRLPIKKVLALDFFLLPLCDVDSSSLWKILGDHS